MHSSTNPGPAAYVANSGSTPTTSREAEVIALARKMGAKAWELRATMGLAGLLAKQGRRDEARATLADIYGWFIEGFDTVDLTDAKALLEEMRN